MSEINTDTHTHNPHIHSQTRTRTLHCHNHMLTLHAHRHRHSHVDSHIHICTHSPMHTLAQMPICTFIYTSGRTRGLHLLPPLLEESSLDFQRVLRPPPQAPSWPQHSLLCCCSHLCTHPDSCLWLIFIYFLAPHPHLPSQGC